MKKLFTVTWLIIFSLICIEHVESARILDGTCIQQCIKEGGDFSGCKDECTILEP